MSGKEVLKTTHQFHTVSAEVHSCMPLLLRSLLHLEQVLSLVLDLTRRRY